MTTDNKALAERLSEDMRTLAAIGIPIEPKCAARWADRLEALTREPSTPSAQAGWLQDGSLLYRLTDERRPQNRDEIRVSMVDGSRDDSDCAAAATRLLAAITSSAQAGEVLWDAMQNEGYLMSSGPLSEAHEDDQEAIARILQALYGTPQPQGDASPEARGREADRRRFSDPAFNRWLDEGISDAGHTVWDAVGDVQAAWAGWEARQFAGDAVLLAECCGREECGGECGNDWRGMSMYRKPDTHPAPAAEREAGKLSKMFGAATQHLGSLPKLFSAEEISRLNWPDGEAAAGRQSAAEQASPKAGEVEKLVKAARDARFALYGNGPGNPELDAALAPFTAAQQKGATNGQE